MLIFEDDEEPPAYAYYDPLFYSVVVGGALLGIAGPLPH